MNVESRKSCTKGILFINNFLFCIFESSSLSTRKIDIKSLKLKM